MSSLETTYILPKYSQWNKEGKALIDALSLHQLSIVWTTFIYISSHKKKLSIRVCSEENLRMLFFQNELYSNEMILKKINSRYLNGMFVLDAISKKRGMQ